MQTVKRSENGVITDPFFLTPEHQVYDAEHLMGKYRISGVPIVNNEEDLQLVGIITNRDLRFIQDYSLKIDDVMTKEQLLQLLLEQLLKMQRKFFNNIKLKSYLLLMKTEF